MEKHSGIIRKTKDMTPLDVATTSFGQSNTLSVCAVFNSV